MFFSIIIQNPLIMTLPEAFIDDCKTHIPVAEQEAFIHALTESEPAISLRYNRAKYKGMEGQPIGWNPQDGAYLPQRPNFTLDPLLHAGCYYVQEASSQFVTHVLRTLVKEPVVALDLCAAPGGKSTAMLSALPGGSQLVSNEIDRRRARILSENITKWGMPNVSVTCNAPSDFRKLTHLFDLILTDVPCSGEGMFRKDEGAIKDWSPRKVEECVTRQKEILETIWPTLKTGGILIYSTCTFNVHENEEMLQYICEELGAEALDIPVDASWNIHPPLVGDLPCYRFMPHFTRGEGLFLAAVRKERNDKESARPVKRDNKKKGNAKIPGGTDKHKLSIDIKKTTADLLKQLVCDASIELTADGTLRAIPTGHMMIYDALMDQGLYLLQSGIEMGTIKGRDIVPAHALALSTIRKDSAFATVDVDLETALNYLRHEAISLGASVPTGYVIITYQGHALGFVKNLGNRCNNMYPQEWRIRFL